MSSAILSHLLNLLGDPTGTLKTLLRKGLAALRGLFGRGKGFFREVIKRVASFWTRTAKPAADAARQKVGDALLSLARSAKAAWPQDPTPPAGDTDDLDTTPEPAAPLPEEPAATAEPEETAIFDADEAPPTGGATPADSALPAGIASTAAPATAAGPTIASTSASSRAAVRRIASTAAGPTIASTSASSTAAGPTIASTSASSTAAGPTIASTSAPNSGSSEAPSRQDTLPNQLATIAPLLRRTLLRALQGGRTAQIRRPAPSPIMG